MKTIRIALFIVLFLPITFAFTISDYHNDVTVNKDGSIGIYEKITMNLDQEYVEGFRTIRKEEFNKLTDIVIKDVKVNGQNVPSGLRLDGQKADIVWKRTFKGENVIELKYTITNRVELYSDYARLCYAHVGADWPVPIETFSAKTLLPQGAANGPVYAYAYSNKEVETRTVNSSVILEGSDIPPASTIEACYLFERTSVNTSNTVPAPAYFFLWMEEAGMAFSGAFTSERPYAEWFCLPIFLMSAILATSLTLRERRRPKLMETLTPPDDEEPAVVTALVRNNYEIRELAASAMMSLISRGIVELAEPEKGNRKKTMLRLKNRPAGLKDHEKELLSLVFGEGKQLELESAISANQAAKDQQGASRQEIANKAHQSIHAFTKAIRSLFQDEEVEELSNSAPFRKSTIILSYIIVGIILALFLGGSFSGERLSWYVQHNEYFRMTMIGLTSIGFMVCAFIAAMRHMAPKVPQYDENLKIYGKWDAFYRGIKAEKSKELPMPTEKAWGSVIVYATALGLAEKLKKHLEGLSFADPKLRKRIEALDNVAILFMEYFDTVTALSKIAAIESEEQEGEGSG